MSRRLGNGEMKGLVVPVFFVLLAAEEGQLFVLDSQHGCGRITRIVVSPAACFRLNNLRNRGRVGAVYLAPAVHLQDDGDSNFDTVETPQKVTFGVHTVLL